jgi:hypothetical protein
LPGTHTAATITVAQTLELLDGPYAALAAGVSSGEFAFWIGSGISRGRVVGLDGVLRKLIEFLRTIGFKPLTRIVRFAARWTKSLD